ncbi:MAG: class I SAM-dependent methyltransferase [Elusimicrobiota bacterium]|nr:class I SAM-dependent methyltransferase [Elusimicrobiota bacterium]
MTADLGRHALLALEATATALRWAARMRRDAAEDRRRGLVEPVAALRVELGVVEDLGDGPVGRRRDSTHSAPTPHETLDKLAALLRPTAADAFLDLGCGAGRALAVLKRAGAGRCVGVELGESALRLARANAAALGAGVEVFAADAGAPPDDALDAATIVFAGDAFGADTLDDFLDALQASLARRPRPVRFAYFEPAHRACLDERPWLVEQEGLPDERLALWRTKML